MRRVLLVVSLLPVLSTGCLVELLTTTAIQGELAAQDAQASAQALHYAKDSQARIQAEQAIRAYQAETGTYPPSLAALVPRYLAAMPVHWDGQPFGYNPATGKLLDQPAPARNPAAVTAADQRNLDRIGQAIYRYWESTGLYPTSLGDLAPIYLDRVPTLESGAPFMYDPQAGAVYFPPALQPAAPGGAGASNAPRAAPVGGAGPLGETMTGIAIQNELSNMNTSGVASAGGAARRGIADTANSYNDRQSRAADRFDP